jgi:hypothetical protein
MPIRQYINGARFDFETIRVLGVALEMARCALRSEERGDGNDEIIAKHIIELAHLLRRKTRLWSRSSHIRFRGTIRQPAYGPGGD